MQGKVGHTKIVFLLPERTKLEPATSLTQTFWERSWKCRLGQSGVFSRAFWVGTATCFFLDELKRLKVFSVKTSVFKAIIVPLPFCFSGNYNWIKTFAFLFKFILSLILPGLQCATVLEIKLEHFFIAGVFKFQFFSSDLDFQIYFPDS